MIGLFLRSCPRLALVLLAAVAGLVELRAQAAEPPSLSKVDALVEAFLRDEPAVGVVVGIMKGGDVVHVKGYGLSDLERGVPATPHSVFRIASLSKQFTATSILLLAEDGRIKLDAGIRTYFPELPAALPEPTVAHLLNHTSGFDFQAGWNAILPSAATTPSTMRDLSPQTVGKLFAAASFEFQPGTRFRYNNNAFLLLGLLIERVSGMSYAAFVERRIFKPLGMNESGYVDTTAITKNRAAGYTFRGTEIVNTQFSNMHSSYAAGALGSTVLDLLKWQRALTQGSVLPEPVVRAMQTPGRLSDGTPIPYGMGLFLLKMGDIPKIGHYGNVAGFRSEIAYYPTEQLTVVVLSNTNPARTDMLESRISRSMMGVSEKSMTERELLRSSLEAYAGLYVVTDAPISHRSVTTEIVMRDDGLYVGRYRLHAVGDDTFVPAGDPYHHYTFTVRNGRAVALLVEREGRIIADARRKQP